MTLPRDGARAMPSPLRPTIPVGVSAPLLGRPAALGPRRPRALTGALAAFFEFVPIDARLEDLGERGLRGAVLDRPAPLTALPTIRAAELDDPRLRAHFVERVFAYDAWLRLRTALRARRRPGALVAFHARQTARLLARDPDIHARLARLVARASDSDDLGPLVEQYGAQFNAALARPPSGRSAAHPMSPLVAAPDAPPGRAPRAPSLLRRALRRGDAPAARRQSPLVDPPRRPEPRSGR